MGIELASLALLSLILISSTLIGILTGNGTLWMDGFLVGIVASLPVRMLSVLAMSRHNLPRKVFAGIAPPLAITRSFFGIVNGFAAIPNVASFSFRGTVVLGIAVIMAASGCLWIVRKVEKTGNFQLAYSPMHLFRAFLDHWLGSDPARLEENLKILGVQRDIDTRIIAFGKNNGKPESSIIVSNFHPGPYRDLGSAALPSRLKQFVSNNIGGIVHVPHSISNHELNIISRDNIEKLLSSVKNNYPLNLESNTASPMIRRVNGEATVTGQTFGHVVVLMITLAPGEMEDLPEEVSKTIEQQALQYGMKVLTVDAHNSISGQTIVNPSQVQNILEAASHVLHDLSQLHQSSVLIGQAEDSLKEFNPVDGIGPGGLVVTLVKTDSQIAGYLTIDGNNMQQGFRQTILDSIKTWNVAEAEVMTTDTHLVTGLVRSPLGYYPVGAHLSKPYLMQKIHGVVKRALDNLQPLPVGFSQFTVNVEVLGQSTFDMITGFIGGIGRRIARWFYWLELSTILLSCVLLYIL
jgi:putative membrane protein